MEDDPTETTDPGPFRKMARVLLDELLQDELAAEGGAEVPLTVVAARALDQGAAIAEALAAEMSIAKNRWWEQSRQPAGIPQGGRFADMGAAARGAGVAAA